MKQKKRITKQVRVHTNTHRMLKFEAIKRGKTISMLLDEICKDGLPVEFCEEKIGAPITTE